MEIIEDMKIDMQMKSDTEKDIDIVIELTISISIVIGIKSVGLPSFPSPPSPNLLVDLLNNI